MKKYLLTLAVFVLMCVVNVDEAKAQEYVIKINKNTNVVTVYDKATGKPEKAFVCSVGNATPIGTFKTSDKYRWHTLVGPSYGQYCTRITGQILFHSVWYYKNKNYASQNYREFKKLGTTASHGCVRLTVADAKWIYDNCAKGTTVVIFKGTSKNDPLGKPVAPQVVGNNRGWDPTDPSPENPYLQMIPVVHMKQPERTVETYVPYNLKEGVVARRANGEYISWTIKVFVSEPGSTVRKPVNTATYTFNKVGVYKVFYKAQDPVNLKTRTVMATFTVKDMGRLKINGTYTQTIKVKTTQNLLKGVTDVTATTASGSSFTKQLKVYVKSPGATSYALVPKGMYTFGKTGTYDVRYEAVNPFNNKKTTVTVQRKVK